MEDKQEEQRLIITIGILATLVGIYTLPAYSNGFWGYARGLVLIPSLFAFLYVLFTGSHLKYKNGGEIGELPITEKWRQRMYDFALDSFWTSFTIGTMFGFAYMFGWKNGDDLNTAFFSGLILSSIIIFPLLIFSLRAKRSESKAKGKS